MLEGGVLFQKSPPSFPGATHTQQMSVQNREHAFNVNHENRAMCEVKGLWNCGHRVLLALQCQQGTEIAFTSEISCKTFIDTIFNISFGL